MTRLAFLFSAVLLVVSLPGGLAGPACSKKHFKAVDCAQKCKSKWGWSGRMMGTDPWGNVMKKASSAESLDAVLSKACGIEVTQTSVPTQPVVNAHTGSFTFSSNATTSSVPQTSSITSVTKPFASSSITRSASSSVEPTSSTARPPPVTTPAPPLPPVTTSNTPPTTSTSQPRTTQAPARNPPPSAGGTSSGTSDSDIQAYLSSHNSVRASHGAAALTWSDDLASKAQEWANGCVFQHSGGKFGRLGENLAAGTGSYSIQTAIKSWTDEVSDYNPSNPQPSHFTQVVWKATTQVGCAVQSCDGIFDASFGKAKYYVCEYSPAGNVIGQFAQNVQV